MTNGDKLRAMTDEELAKLIWAKVYCGRCPVKVGCAHLGYDYCFSRLTTWLKQESEDTK